MNYFLLLFCLMQVLTSEAVLVCPHLYQYTTYIGCHNSKDSSRNTSQVVQSWGFSAEDYIAVTEDGYHIGITRLYKEITKENPVIIGHGILMNGQGFTAINKKSVAYVLAEQGYEVWLITFRGGKYSLGHNTLTPYQYEFWDFSFDQMIHYDFKAATDLIYSMTPKKALYIGYSMGTQVGLGYGSVYPEDQAKKILGIAALAPAVYFIDQRSWAKYMIPFMPLIMNIDKHLFNGRFFYWLPTAGHICALGLLPMLVCHGLLGLLFGADYKQIDSETYPLFLTNVPDQVCTKVLNHMFQLYETTEFKQYDYGREENLIKYGSEIPPFYNMSNVPVPVSMWIGANDWISTIQTCNKVNTILQEENRCKINIVPWDKWTHLDYLMAKDIKSLFFNNFLPELEKLAEGTCTV